MLTETFTIDATAYTVTYTYDVAINVLSIQYPGGSGMAYYAYDAFNRACAVGTSSSIRKSVV